MSVFTPRRVIMTLVLLAFAVLPPFSDAVGEPFYFKYGTKPSCGCNAGMIRMPPEATEGKDVLLFSAPDIPGKSRHRMTVFASFDQDKTWPVKRLVNEGMSAYSSLAATRDGTSTCSFKAIAGKLHTRLRRLFVRHQGATTGA